MFEQAGEFGELRVGEVSQLTLVHLLHFKLHGFEEFETLRGDLNVDDAAVLAGRPRVTSPRCSRRSSMRVVSGQREIRRRPSASVGMLSG